MPRYQRDLLSPGEEIVREFRPHWSRVLREILIFVGTIAVAAFVLWLPIIPDEWQWIGVLVVVLVALFVTLPNIVRWRFSEYVITNERVITREGVIRKAGKEIPLEVINDVAFTQNMFERIFGTGDVTFESAGEFGQNHYRDIPHPEQIQTLIYRLRENRSMQLRGLDQAPEAPMETLDEEITEGSPKSKAEQLEILSRLHDEGKLTDGEFEDQKRRLLDD
ncbi:MAG: PH domain-containing protein [Acidimicrobiia bacterium]